MRLLNCAIYYMFDISNFFKKFHGAFAKEVLIRSTIREAILKYTGAEVPLTAIAFKSETVILEGVSQSLKSAIYIKKQAILKEIALKQNMRAVTDIR